MEVSIAEKVRELERENALLKSQLLLTKSQIYGWDSIKQYIKDELYDLDKTRTYGCFNRKIEEGISQIIRQTFNLNFTRHINNSNYEESKIIAETIILLVKKYYVKDRWCE